MSTFIGKYEAKADVKGRIFIPSAYRKLLPDGERERVVMLKDAEIDCLVVFPESVWITKVHDLQSKMNEWDRVDRSLMSQFVSDAEQLDIDSQGRILISKKNMQAIGAENSDILFVGMIDRFAIWSKTKYEESRMSPSEFSRLLKEKMLKE